MFKNKHTPARGGFTLIELLVVIAIIGLLASVVMASLNSARAKARDASRRATVRQVKTALEFYYDTSNAYASIGPDGAGIPWAALSTPLAPYMSTVPADPGGTGRNIQYVRGPADAYGIYVEYELTGPCKTGVNINTGWWGGTVPIC